jgi:hypothetical protein
MQGPSGFFCFDHEVPQRRAPPQRYAIAYKPPGRLQRGALDDLLASLCRGPVLPDVAVIVGLQEEVGDELGTSLRTETSQLAQQRLTGRIPLVHATYSLRTGALQFDVLDPAFERRRDHIDGVLAEGIPKWLRSGLEAVFDPTVVLLQAPSGYAYQKPSGARSEYFLKPDLGLDSSASVGLVALALFARLYAGRLEGFADLQSIFVDTMAIAPVAYALRELLELCGHDKPFHIESFHSYGGFESVTRPLPRTSLCLISASSSMALHREWVAEKHVSLDEVATLLTFTTAGKLASEALLALVPPKSVAAPGPAQLAIRIKGETFLPEQETAKKVLLSDQHHRSDDDVALFRQLAGTGVFDIYRRPARAASKVRALFIDGEALLQQQGFLEWLERQLLQSVKAATGLIVFQDDGPSRQLADLVRIFCEQRFSLPSVNVISAQQLANATVGRTTGVVVCSSVAGKGSQLLEISRALRDKHDGPRLNVIGYQVTETRGELTTLRSNLAHSKGVPHEVARYGYAAVGTQLSSSFEQEVKLFYGPNDRSRPPPPALAHRASLLGGTYPIAALALLPHGAKVTCAMRLRPGFAYWPDGYEAEPYQPEVLATVAVLLQRAREHDKLPDDRRLASGSYRHVVLDPENFARFNDGVLQSALLRCAYPSELDYRSDHAASDFLRALILRALARAEQEAGEATLEFLLALKMRRLQLSKVHLSDVLAAALRRADRSPTLRQAIDYLLRAGRRRKKSDRHLPF